MNYTSVKNRRRKRDKIEKWEFVKLKKKILDNIKELEFIFDTRYSLKDFKQENTKFCF